MAEHTYIGDRPFTPETLAKRWGCSPSQVRKLIRVGNHLGQKLRAFQIGHGLYRIPAEAVGEYERCGSGDVPTDGGTPSIEGSEQPSKQRTETPPSKGSRTLNLSDPSRQEARLRILWGRT